MKRYTPEERDHPPLLNEWSVFSAHNGVHFEFDVQTATLQQPIVRHDGSLGGCGETTVPVRRESSAALMNELVHSLRCVCWNTLGDTLDGKYYGYISRCFR